MRESPGVSFFLITEDGALIRRDVKRVSKEAPARIGPVQQVLPPGSFKYP